jgi:hypothetical protein
MSDQETLKRDETLREANFRDTLFAVSPERYQILFAEEMRDEEIESEEFEWIVPQTEEEAMALLADVQQVMGDL